MPSFDLVACGMYAFTPGLRAAWAALFAGFELAAPAAAPVELCFDPIERHLREPRLLLAHTCGYPLASRLHRQFVPVCVGEFAVDGARGTDYRSQLVVAADSSIGSLADCRGGRAAINATDSNSGMNLLRDALVRAGARPGFFRAVHFSGAHLASAEAVAAGQATVAAIDCITWRYIGDAFPALAARLRIIGQTRATTGLPWVAPVDVATAIGTAALVDALNRALEAAPPAVGERLHLRAFRAIELGHYRPLLDLERAAAAAGYPEIG